MSSIGGSFKLGEIPGSFGFLSAFFKLSNLSLSLIYSGPPCISACCEDVSLHIADGDAFLDILFYSHIFFQLQ